MELQKRPVELSPNSHPIRSSLCGAIRRRELFASDGLLLEFNRPVTAGGRQHHEGALDGDPLLQQRPSCVASVATLTLKRYWSPVSGVDTSCWN